jgi:hypothetical protein
VTTLLALLAAVIGCWAIRRERHGRRAAVDAGCLAVVLLAAAGGAWLVQAWRGLCDGTPGALAGAVVGVVATQLIRDRLIGR